MHARAQAQAVIIAFLMVFSMVGPAMAVPGQSGQQERLSSSVAENVSAQSDANFVQVRNGDNFTIWDRAVARPLNLDSEGRSPGGNGFVLQHPLIDINSDGDTISTFKDRIIIREPDETLTLRFEDRTGADVDQFSDKTFDVIVAETDEITDDSGETTSKLLDLLSKNGEAEYDYVAEDVSYDETYTYNLANSGTGDHVFYLVDNDSVSISNGNIDSVNQSTQVYGVEYTLVEDASSQITINGSNENPQAGDSFDVNVDAGLNAPDGDVVHVVQVLKENNFKSGSIQVNVDSDTSDLSSGDYTADVPYQAVVGESNVEDVKLFGENLSPQQKLGKQDPGVFISPYLQAVGADSSKIRKDPNGKVLNSSLVVVKGDNTETIEINTSDNWTSGDYEIAHIAEVKNSGDGGVADADDLSASRDTVSIDAGASYQIDSVSLPQNVTAGESIEAEITLSNTGSIAESQTVELTKGSQTASTTVNFDPGNTTSVNLSVSTDTNDPPDVTVTANTEDDQNDNTVTVLKQPEFTVTIDGQTTDVVDEGDNATIVAEIENTNSGTAEGTRTITASTQNGPSIIDDTRTVTLQGGGSTTVSFETVEASSNDRPEFSASVNVDSGAGGDSTTIDVNGSFFDISASASSTQVNTGDTIDVEVTVTNDGTVADSTTVDISPSGAFSTESKTTNQLNAGETETLTFTSNELQNDITVNASSSDDSNDSGNIGITVLDPADFNVALQPGQSEVAAGEVASFNVTIENQGEETDTKTLTVSTVGGPGIDGSATRDVTLSESDSETFSFTTKATDSNDAPDFDIEADLDSSDSSATATISVSTGARFAVGTPSTNAPVVEGDVLNVSATIENTGTEQATQDLELSIGGDGKDSTSITLDGGATTTETLSYQTQDGDAPSVDATLATDNESATISPDVQAPASLGLSIDNGASDDEVFEGGTAEVDVDLTNDGDVSGEETVEVTATVNGDTTTVASRTVTVSPGETTETFEISTNNVDAAAGDTLSVEVSGTESGDTDSKDISVTDPPEDPFFEVDIEPTGNAVQGQPYDFTVNVTNAGDLEDTQTIKVETTGGPDFAGEATGEESVTLTGNSFSTTSFSTDTVVSGDAPSFGLEARSANATDNVTVDVDEPAAFNIQVDSTNGPVVGGETLSIDVTVTNDGDQSGEEKIELDVDGDDNAEDTVTVSLDPGGSTSETLTYTTTEDDVGTIDASVGTSDDADRVTRSITVQQPATFTVQSVTALRDPVAVGDTLEVEATVENTGDVRGTKDLGLEVRDGLTKDVESSVSLDSDESTTTTLSYTTEDKDAPEVEAAVVSEDSSASTTVGVGDSAFFDVSIDSVDDGVTAGEGTVSVDVSIENTGDLQDDKTIELLANGVVEDSAQVSLAGGASTTQTLEYATEEGDSPSVPVQIESEDDSESEDARVYAPAEFVINDLGTNEPVVEGEALEVEATVENVGGVSGTQDVSLSVDGSSAASSSVNIPAGASTTVTLTETTASGDAPTVAATVATEDDSASTEADVLEPADLGVVIASNATTNEVIETRNATLAVDVSNAGDVEADETLQVTVNNDGSVIDDRTVTVSPEGASRARFDIDPDAVGASPGDTLNIQVDGTESGDSPSTTIDVIEAPDDPFFDVSIDTPESINVGETATVDVTVENAGDLEGTQDITLSTTSGPAIAGSATEQVTLGGGDTTTLSFDTEAAADADAPDFEVSASSANASASDLVNINRLASFDVSIDSTNDPLTGEDLVVGATIENTGDLEDTQTVSLSINGTQVDSITRTLDGGQSRTPRFRYTTSESDLPAVDVSVDSADDEDSTVVSLEEAPEFEVTVDSTNGPIVRGQDTLQVDATVENTGGTADTQDVRLNIRGFARDRVTNVQLGPDESDNVSLQYDSQSVDADNLDATVTTDDTSVTETVTVNAPAEFQVNDITTQDPVVAGNELDVDVDLENVGDTSGQQQVDLQLGDTLADRQSVGLGAGATETVTLNNTVTQEDAPVVDVDVLTNDDSESGSATIDQPATYEVTLEDANGSVAAGEDTIVVEATVENTGDEAGSKAVQLRVDGALESSTTVDLDAGASQTVTLSYATDSSDTGELEVATTTADDSDSTIVVGNTPAEFAASIDSVNEPVVGDQLAVEATIENVGGSAGTDTVELELGDVVVDSADVSLDAGGSESVNFTYTTESGDDIFETVTVVTDQSDSQSANVLSPPAFDLSVDESASNGEINESRTATVVVNVSNTGDVAGDETLDVTVDGDSTAIDDQTVTVEGESTATTTVGVDTEALGATQGDSLAIDVEGTESGATASTTVDVTQPVTQEFFEVSADAPDAVDVGETATVDVTVENIGDTGQPDTQTVQLSVDSGPAINGSTSESLQLDGGESDTLTFETEAASSGDAPQFDLTASSEDATNTETVDVNLPASFEVTAIETNQPVAGDFLEVDADIENTGDLEATSEVTLSTDGTAVSNESLTLAGGDSETLSFQAPTAEADDTVDVTVSADTDNTTSVDLVDPAAFQVTSFSANSSIVAGETVVADATIENTGGAEGAQTVDLEIDDTVEDRARVTLGAGETETVSLASESAADDSGSLSATASTDDDDSQATVGIDQPATLEITSISPNDNNVITGDSIGVDVTVENTGDVSTEDEVQLTVRDIVRDSASVQLGAGESTTETLTYTTLAADAPSLNVSAATGDDTATESADVSRPASFEIDSVETEDPDDQNLQEGDTLQVTANVTNTGGVEESQEVSLFVRGTERDNQSLQVAPGATEEVTLEYVTVEGDAPTVSAAVETDDDAEDATADVFREAEFDVSIVDVNNSIAFPETLVADVEIENVGDESATQDVSVTFGEGTATQSITLGARNSTTESFAIDLGDFEDQPAEGPQNVLAESEDDSSAREISVGAAANFLVDVDDAPDSVTAGENADVSVSVENTGEGAATQTIVLEADGDRVDEETVQLAAGASDTLTLTESTRPGDAGTTQLIASSTNDEAAAQLEVLQPASLQLGDLEVTPETAEGGETLTAEATVTNNGDVSGSTTVTFTAAGETIASEPVTVPGGENATVETDYTSTESDVGALEFTADADDQTVADVVTVQAPAAFEVSIDQFDSTVVENETTDVVVTVENTGGVTDTTDVSLSFDGTQRDAATGVQLDGGNATTLNFSYQPATPTTSDLEIETATETVSESVEVVEEANFRVQDVSSPDTVEIDGTALVEATIKNVGDETESQTITLSSDAAIGSTPLYERTTEVGLAADENETVTFELPVAAPGDPLSLQLPRTAFPPVETGLGLTAASEDTSSSTSIEIVDPDPAELEIAAVSAGDVAGGEESTVQVGLENTGDLDVEDGQINLTYDGPTETNNVSTTVDLAGGDATTETIAFSVPDEPRAGTRDAEIRLSTADDSATEAVSVDFGSIQSGLEAADAGDRVVVEAGTYTEPVTVGTPNVRLVAPDGARLDTDGNTLLGIRADGVEVSGFEISGADRGTGVQVSGSDATLSSLRVSGVDTGVDLVGGTGHDLRGVSVIEPAGTGIQVESDSTDIRFARVSGGTSGITISGADVELRSSRVASTRFGITLTDDAGFVRMAQNELRGNQIAIIVAGGEAGRPSVFLNGNFIANDIAILNQLGAAGAAVTADDTVTAQNDPDSFDAATNYWGSDDGPSDADVVEEGSGTTITSDSQNDRYEGATFEVLGYSVADRVLADETLTATVEVANTGDLEGSDEIALVADGQVVDTTTVELDAGGSTEVELAYAPSSDNAGDVSLAAETSDDSQSQTVTVEEPEFFDIQIDSADSQVQAGDTFNVDVTVENTGDLADAQGIDLAIEDSPLAAVDGTVDTTVSDLDPGESETVQLTYQTDPIEAGTLTATVSSDDEAVTQTVDVIEETPGAFDVTIDDGASDSTVTPGQTASVVATIENVGGTALSDTVTLNVDGVDETTRTVDLDAGQSTTERFDIATTDDDAGSSIDIDVVTLDDTDSLSLAVEAADTGTDDGGLGGGGVGGGGGGGGVSDADTPEPDIDTPEPDTPEPDTPEPDTPEPETDTPEPETPETDTPEPETDTPVDTPSEPESVDGFSAIVALIALLAVALLAKRRRSD